MLCGIYASDKVGFGTPFSTFYEIKIIFYPSKADACFEAALQLVNDLPAATIDFDGKPRSLERYLVSYLCNMLATLIVVPDSPEQGVLYFLRLLVDVVGRHEFKSDSTARVTIYLHALDMLYVQSLEKFPYHIQGGKES